MFILYLYVIRSMPCSICNARFAEHECIYCNSRVCSGCIDNDARKCIRCKDLKSMPNKRFLRKNIHLFIFIGLAWLFIVFPYPFLLGYEHSLHYAVLIPVIVATVGMIVPLIFLFRYWKRNGV
jgi:hypothetical protein